MEERSKKRKAPAWLDTPANALKAPSVFHFNGLPIDILVMIFRYTPTTAKVRTLALVCKRWRTAVRRSITSVVVTDRSGGSKSSSDEPSSWLHDRISKLPSLTEITFKWIPPVVVLPQTVHSLAIRKSASEILAGIHTTSSLTNLMCEVPTLCSTSHVPVARPPLLLFPWRALLSGCAASIINLHLEGEAESLKELLDGIKFPSLRSMRIEAQVFWSSDTENIHKVLAYFNGMQSATTRVDLYLEFRANSASEYSVDELSTVREFSATNLPKGDTESWMKRLDKLTIKGVTQRVTANVRSSEVHKDDDFNMLIGGSSSLRSLRCAIAIPDWVMAYDFTFPRLTTLEMVSSKAETDENILDTTIKLVSLRQCTPLLSAIHVGLSGMARIVDVKGKIIELIDLGTRYSIYTMTIRGFWVTAVQLLADRPDLVKYIEAGWMNFAFY